MIVFFSFRIVVVIKYFILWFLFCNLHNFNLFLITRFWTLFLCFHNFAWSFSYGWNLLLLFFDRDRFVELKMNWSLRPSLISHRISTVSSSKSLIFMVDNEKVLLHRRIYSHCWNRSLFYGKRVVLIGLMSYLVWSNSKSLLSFLIQNVGVRSQWPIVLKALPNRHFFFFNIDCLCKTLKLIFRVDLLFSRS